MVITIAPVVISRAKIFLVNFGCGDPIWLPIGFPGADNTYSARTTFKYTQRPPTDPTKSILTPLAIFSTCVLFERDNRIAPTNFAVRPPIDLPIGFSEAYNVSGPSSYSWEPPTQHSNCADPFSPFSAYLCTAVTPRVPLRSSKNRTSTARSQIASPLVSTEFSRFEDAKFSSPMSFIQDSSSTTSILLISNSAPPLPLYYKHQQDRPPFLSQPSPLQSLHQLFYLNS